MASQVNLTKEQASWYGSVERKAASSGWLRAFASGCSNFSIQYNYQSASIAMAVMATQGDHYMEDPALADFPAAPWVNKMMLAVVFGGSVTGMVFMGYLGDLVGRRPALIFTKSLVVLGAVMCALLPAAASDFFWHYLALARFLLGVGLGGAFPLTASTAGQVEQVGQAFFWQTPGTVAPYLVTLLLLQILPGDTSAQFRWILGLGALPALLALVAALPQQEKPLTPKASLPEALSCPDVQRCLLGTAGSWFLFDTACYGTVIFTPQILSHIFGQDQSLVQLALHSILLMIFAIPATGLAVLALPRLGPRKLNAYGFVLQAALFATVAATYGLIQNIHSAVLTLLCALYFSLNWGPGLATYVLPIEVFPEEFRSTLHGFSAAAGKLGALVGAGLFPFIDAAYGVPAVMALQAVVCALGALLSYLCLGIDLGCAAASAVSDA
ncbi:unnamed protein product [Effrenium voratum]|uniref:Major facilitator superfamily (MFS) profile domain-containing protein n=1 Tax=Effrenium voratum TaxID=2562239 RepID=A0AA36I5F1_9DINO|nr:unnamed protein product [Effrenium voratum]